MKAQFIWKLACATALATGLVGQAMAAENEDGKVKDIVVTADKFEKSVQKTPIAVSVVTGDEVTQLGRTKIDDVLANQPAVVIQGAARGFLVSIRGLGLSLPPQMGAGAVSTNYDGFYSSRAENASAGFYDLERVEVLRGPQSTLYGRNSVGGVVNMISRDPTLGDVNGYVTTEAGNYGLFHGEGAVNVPLSDTMAVRVSGSMVSRDGYVSNGHDDNKSRAGRVKFLYQPTDAIKLVLGAERVALRGKGPGGLPISSVEDNSRVTTDVAYGSQHINYAKYFADLKAEVGPGVVRALASLQETKGRTLGAFGGNFANSLDPKLTRQKSFELRYSSAPGAPAEWNVGFYHYDNHNIQQTISGACQDVAGNYVVPDAGYNAAPGGPPGPAPEGECLAEDDWVRTNYQPEVRDNRTDGLFGQVTVPVSDRVRVIAGARYTWEKVAGVNDANANSTTVFTADPQALPTQKDGHFDYRLGVEANVGEASLFYATTASGYRQGGFGFGGAPFDPEKMTSYEIGLKNKLADGKVLLNLSGFYYDYKSFQLVIANFAASPPEIYVPTMPAREYGLELETVVAVGEGGKLNGSLTYLDSRLGGLDGFYEGLSFPNSPKWQLKTGYSHEFAVGEGTIVPRADLRVLSGQMVYPEDHAVASDSPSYQRGYTTGDLSVTYNAPGGYLSLTGYVKNVNNKMYKTSHFFGYAQVGAPRTVGLTGTYKF